MGRSGEGADSLECRVSFATALDRIHASELTSELISASPCRSTVRTEAGPGAGGRLPFMRSTPAHTRRAVFSPYPVVIGRPNVRTRCPRPPRAGRRAARGPARVAVARRPRSRLRRPPSFKCQTFCLLRSCGRTPPYAGVYGRDLRGSGGRGWLFTYLARSQASWSWSSPPWPSGMLALMKAAAVGSRDMPAPPL